MDGLGQAGVRASAIGCLVVSKVTILNGTAGGYCANRHVQMSFKRGVDVPEQSHGNIHRQKITCPMEFSVNLNINIA